jgi:hypothetical protein
MLRYTVRPLTPEALTRMSGKGSEHSPFRSTWSATEQLLDREVRALGGRNVVIMADCSEADLRLDGQLRANARPATPRCAVAFESRKGPLMFACGRYRTWQDNVRAIALGLEALRKIDRYGIVATDEQYTGFRAIGTGQHPDWAETLATYSGLSPEQVIEDVTFAYRRAARATHPDTGGTHEAYIAVKQAFDLATTSRSTAHV